MRKSMSYMAIGLLVLLSISLMSSSVVAIDTTGDPKFEYGIAEGDELQYNIVTDLNIVASDAFYNEIGDFITTMVENQTGMPVFAADFSMKSLVQDFEVFLKEQMKTKLTIGEIFNIDSDPADNLSIDYIIGDVRMNVNGEWVLPTNYIIARANNLSTALEPHFDATFYDDYLDEQVDQLPILFENVTEADFNNLPLGQNLYFENLSDTIGFENAPSLENGTKFPALPNDHYLPGVMSTMFSESAGPGVSGLFFPKDFSFKAYYDWAIAVYNFMKIYIEENPEAFPEGFPLTDYTIPELFAMFGVSTFNVNKQSVGVTWASNEIDFPSIANLIGFNESEVLTTIEDAFSSVSLIYDDCSVTLTMALEYDSDMVLSSYCFYADVIIGINGTTIPAETGIELGNEVVEVHWVESITKEGVAAPTEEEIQNGELGENRKTATGTTPPFNIPGYSLALLGLVSITAVLSVIKRVKRQ